MELALSLQLKEVLDKSVSSGRWLLALSLAAEGKFSR